MYSITFGNKMPGISFPAKKKKTKQMIAVKLFYGTVIADILYDINSYFQDLEYLNNYDASIQQIITTTEYDIKNFLIFYRTDKKPKVVKPKAARRRKIIAKKRINQKK